MEGGPGPLPMQKCLSLSGSGVLAAPSTTHAAGALLHSERLHLSRPFKVAPTFRRRRGGVGVGVCVCEEPGGGRKWDGDAAEGGRTESERGGEREREAAERSGGVQALLGAPENTTAGWRSRRVCVKERLKPGC